MLVFICFRECFLKLTILNTKNRPMFEFKHFKQNLKIPEMYHFRFLSVQIIVK